jgi:hypothetical protein
MYLFGPQEPRSWFVAAVQTAVQLGRLRPGQGRGLRQRPAADRTGPRNPGGHEAALVRLIDVNLGPAKPLHCAVWPERRKIAMADTLGTPGVQSVRARLAAGCKSKMPPIEIIINSIEPGISISDFADRDA